MIPQRISGNLADAKWMARSAFGISRSRTAAVILLAVVGGALRLLSYWVAIDFLLRLATQEDRSRYPFLAVIEPDVDQSALWILLVFSMGVLASSAGYWEARLRLGVGLSVGLDLQRQLLRRQVVDESSQSEADFLAVAEREVSLVALSYRPFLGLVGPMVLLIGYLVFFGMTDLLFAVLLLPLLAGAAMGYVVLGLRSRRTESSRPASSKLTSTGLRSTLHYARLRQISEHNRLDFVEEFFQSEAGQSRQRSVEDVMSAQLRVRSVNETLGAAGLVLVVCLAIARANSDPEQLGSMLSLLVVLRLALGSAGTFGTQMSAYLRYGSAIRSVRKVLENPLHTPKPDNQPWRRVYRRGELLLLVSARDPRKQRYDGIIGEVETLNTVKIDPILAPRIDLLPALSLQSFFRDETGRIDKDLKKLLVQAGADFGARSRWLQRPWDPNIAPRWMGNLIATASLYNHPATGPVVLSLSDYGSIPPQLAQRLLDLLVTRHAVVLIAPSEARLSRSITVTQVFSDGSSEIAA